MIKLKVGGGTLRITPCEHRGLLAIAGADYALMRSDIWEGRNSGKSPMLNLDNRDSMADLGVTEIYRGTFGNIRPHSKRAAAFFKRHPRCQSVLEGNPRRINAILTKLTEIQK
jgi:hypothetical protein